MLFSTATKESVSRRQTPFSVSTAIFWKLNRSRRTSSSLNPSAKENSASGRSGNGSPLMCDRCKNRRTYCSVRVKQEGNLRPGPAVASGMQEVQMTEVADDGTSVGSLLAGAQHAAPLRGLDERGATRGAGATRARKDAPLAS